MVEASPQPAPQGLLPAERIARCRTTIALAVADPAGTSAFQRRIVDFFTAAGKSEAEATERAMGVRLYIEALPLMLERVLRSALDPEAPAAGAERQMARLNASLAAFEGPSPVPDHFGLAGLLDNAYLAARLLPDEIQVAIDHDPAIQLLGPFTVQQLDTQIEEATAALAATASTSPSGATSSGAASSVKARGVCSACRHIRSGVPTAQAVFDNLLEAVRPSARQAYTNKLREEREMSRHFVEELEALKRNGDIAYTRRPTERRMTYCGVAEFDGLYQCCEVKNLDQQCGDFEMPDSPADRACSTCRHNHQLPAPFLHILQTVAGHISLGQPVRDEIKKTLDAQAQSEYEECVEYGGFVQSGRPGTLPVCEARSGPDGSDATRYLVGPVVNVGRTCDRWQPGENAAVARAMAELKSLEAAAAQAWQDLTSPPVVDANASTYSQQLREVAINADADVIEYGLEALGLYPSSVESLSISYVSHVGQTGITRTPRALREQARANAGYRLKEVPFVVEPGKIYRHPEHFRVTVQCHPDRGFVDVRDDTNRSCPFLFDAFPEGAWQGLQGPDGQRLRAALMLTRATGCPTVHAAWV